MTLYVSKENNLGPDDKIRYIWGLKGPIFILRSVFRNALVNGYFHKPRTIISDQLH